MPTPFSWTPDILRTCTSNWIFNLDSWVLDYRRLIKDIEASLPESPETWWSYAHAPWPCEFNPIVETISSALNDGPGLAVLRLDPAITSNQARLTQLLFGCCFGANVTENPGQGDRPLFSIGVEDDPTVGGRYAGNAKKTNQIGFHTDGSGATDREIKMLSMLCIRPARFGGQSRVANSQLAFAALSRNTQNLLQLEIPRQNPYAPDLSESALKRSPIFTPINKKSPWFLFSYHPQRVRNGIRLTTGTLNKTIETALSELETMLEEFACDINLMTYDILFINNQVIAHDRRPFWNDPMSPRLLERFWAGQMVPK